MKSSSDVISNSESYKENGHWTGQKRRERNLLWKNNMYRRGYMARFSSKRMWKSQFYHVSIHPTSLFSAEDCAYRLEEPGPFLLEYVFLYRVSVFSFGLILMSQCWPLRFVFTAFCMVSLEISCWYRLLNAESLHIPIWASHAQRRKVSPLKWDT